MVQTLRTLCAQNTRTITINIKSPYSVRIISVCLSTRDCAVESPNSIPLQNHTDDMTIVDDLVAVFFLLLFFRDENVSISISFYLSIFVCLQ